MGISFDFQGVNKNKMNVSKGGMQQKWTGYQGWGGTINSRKGFRKIIKLEKSF